MSQHASLAFYTIYSPIYISESLDIATEFASPILLFGMFRGNYGNMSDSCLHIDEYTTLQMVDHIQRVWIYII